MTQNRNKLIDLFIGNISNAILHKILEKAIFENKEIFQKYEKEIMNSWKIAKAYREKINPKDAILSGRDAEEIKDKIIRKVRSELSIRISRGYKNIDIASVEQEVDDALRKMKIAK